MTTSTYISRIQAEVSYLRKKKSFVEEEWRVKVIVYQKYGLSSRGEKMECGAIERVKMQQAKMVWPHRKNGRVI